MKLFKDIDHSRIDTLSDGIFAIALTLLGFDLIGSLNAAGEYEDLAAGLMAQWPVYFSFLLGFFVLYAIWYQYHVLSQFAGLPHSIMVWQHGFGLMFASLVPFAAALLGEHLGTEHTATAVVVFGILIFADAPIQLLFFSAILLKGDNPVSADSPFSGETYAKLGALMSVTVSLYGLTAILVAQIAPWVALALYGLYLLSKVNPVTSLNRAIPIVERLLGIGVTTSKS